MYKNIATRIPEAITKEIAYLAKERQVDTSKIVRELLTSAVKEKIIEIALEKYSKRQVSLGKAAELAKIPLADFMKISSERKIPLNYSISSLKEDIKSIRI